MIHDVVFLVDLVLCGLVASGLMRGLSDRGLTVLTPIGTGNSIPAPLREWNYLSQRRSACVDFFLGDVVFVDLAVGDISLILLVGITCEAFLPKVVCFPSPP